MKNWRKVLRTWLPLLLCAALLSGCATYSDNDVGVYPPYDHVYGCCGGFYAPGFYHGRDFDHGHGFYGHDGYHGGGYHGGGDYGYGASSHGGGNGGGGHR